MTAEEAARSRLLQNNTIPCKLSFRWWGTSKTLTSEQKRIAASNFGANKDAISASKKLVNRKNKAYKTLTSLKTDITGYWRSQTLPYTEDGIRLLPQAKVHDFESTMTLFSASLNRAVNELSEVWDSIVDDARSSLGELFNPTDYPSYIAGEFAFEWSYPAITPPEYLAELNPQLYAREQERIRARFEEAAKAAEEALAEELRSMIEHLTERLAPDAQGNRKVFRNSAVENVRDFIQRFRTLNVFNSQQLEDLVNRTNALIANADPENLRRNASLRESIAQSLAPISGALAGMVTTERRRAWMPLSNTPPAAEPAAEQAPAAEAAEDQEPATEEPETAVAVAVAEEENEDPFAEPAGDEDESEVDTETEEPEPEPEPEPQSKAKPQDRRTLVRARLTKQQKEELNQTQNELRELHNDRIRQQEQDEQNLYEFFDGGK